MLTTNHHVTNGAVTVYCGELISVTCTHDNTYSGVTRWEVKGTTAADCVETVLHYSFSGDSTCGLFTITVLTGTSGSIFNSTAQAMVTEELNGAVVECFSTGLLNSQVGNVTLNVHYGRT